jgi:hypothetical protein
MEALALPAAESPSDAPCISYAMRLPPEQDTSSQSLLSSPDENELQRRLSDLCHRHAVPGWPGLVRAILNWLAIAKAAERQRRTGEVRDLISALEQRASQIECRFALIDRSPQARR